MKQFSIVLGVTRFHACLLYTSTNHCLQIGESQWMKLGILKGSVHYLISERLQGQNLRLVGTLFTDRRTFPFMKDFTENFEKEEWGTILLMLCDFHLFSPINDPLVKW